MKSKLKHETDKNSQKKNASNCLVLNSQTQPKQERVWFVCAINGMLFKVYIYITKKSIFY